MIFQLIYAYIKNLKTAQETENSDERKTMDKIVFGIVLALGYGDFVPPNVSLVVIYLNSPFRIFIKYFNSFKTIKLHICLIDLIR